MTGLYDRRTNASLLLNIVTAVGLAAGADLFLLVAGPVANSVTTNNAAYDVPGWIVGTVWVFLFAGLGAARWMLATSAYPDGRSAARLVLCLLVFCAAYPFYTVALRSIAMGLAGDIATVCAGIVVAVLVFRRSRGAAFLVSLVAVWVTFATYLTVHQLWSKR